MPALHRDVLRRHTGRPRKPLEKQKEGRKETRQFGKASIPQHRRLRSKPRNQSVTNRPALISENRHGGAHGHET